MNDKTNSTSNFIRHIIDEDIKNNKNQGKVKTRFPPEPNGYLHIGHAKSICLNFGLAVDYNGQCNLRFDDTNPEKESLEYVDSIKEDVRWLGFKWHDNVRYSSDYFQQLYDYAVQLINMGKAYVCSLDAEQSREYRGTLTEPGKDSPSRNRSIEENLLMFEKMKQGKYADGEYVLRAKIDMASGNMNMRDPVVYRIRRQHHHQTGDAWCIYPMYDFTHCLSDAIEGITHSVCTLEFEDHRPLYDWYLDQLQTTCHPQQIEFARLNLNYTLTSKRKLKQLVDQGIVNGWDDPRLPTISGLRRRGYTPASIREFSERVGVTKVDGLVDMGILEFCIRDDLEHHAPRAMAVLRPLKVVIENYPNEQVEELSAPRHPKDESMGRRNFKMSREIYIDQNDYTDEPPPKYKRLTVGKEVRLRNSYVIKCESVIKDEQGNPVELRCTYDENTLGKKPEGRKVQGVIHWVSVDHSFNAQIREYDRLFTVEQPDSNKQEGDFLDYINADSYIVHNHARVEPSLAQAKAGDNFQFEREGYYVMDKDSDAENLIFNRTVSLRDGWK
ncbi:MAG: glutamine--tRNA ligase/YqeY domain fusion protein [Pseudomonadota bacterium]